MDSESKRSLINIRLQMLVAVFGKRANDDTLEALQRVYCDALEVFPEDVIVKAFKIAEQECERFPTPKALRGICQEKMPGNSWRYRFDPSEDTDPETSQPVQVLIDPDPNCTASSCREPRSAHPGKKCRRVVPSGLGDDKVMFRPQDCPEGRAFLRKFAELAGRK